MEDNNLNLISVIIPTYNSGEKIRRCLDSLCNQSISNYEVIIIDDGSNDNTESIIKEYYIKYKFIRYYNKKNEGVSLARNYGLELSKGKYIIFVDSDDFCENNMLELAYYNISMKKVDWVIYGYFIDKNNKNIKEVKSKNCILAKNNTEIAKSIKFMENNMLIASPWTSIYKKEIIDKFNIKFNKSLNFGEDVLFNLEYLKHIDSLYILNVSLYHYIQYNQGTLTSRYIPNRLEKINYNINKRKEVYKHYNMNTEADYIHFSNMFIKSLYGAIINLFYSECDLSFKTKIKSIKTIITNKEFENYINKSNINTKNIIIFKFLYKIKNAKFFYATFWIINKFLKIKQKLNTI